MRLLAYLRSHWRVALAIVLIFGLALAPRSQHLDQQVTVDEDLTLGRSGDFADALSTGRWQRTYQIGHPEVTVMWLTTLVVPPEQLRTFAGSINTIPGADATRNASDNPAFMASLARARLGLAVVHALLIALASALVWRLARPIVGVIVGGLLSLEPFLVAHGQILRGDALLAELMLVALLAAVAFWREQAGFWALALSAVATGLALLTKTPAVFLLPVIGIVALLSARRWLVVGWGVGAAALYVLLWPAMWVRPLITLQRLLEYTLDKGGSPMDAGSFFMGAAVPDPGPLFYNLVLILRLTPLAVIGFVGVFWVRDRQARALMLTLLGMIIVFSVGLAFAAKKADRYILPIIPIILVLGSFGVSAIIQRYHQVKPAIILAGLLVIQSINLRNTWPYPLAYYDPFMGGAPGASRLVLVGSGEGLDQVGRWLNAQPGASDEVAAVFYPDALDGLYDGKTVPLDSYDVADYAVLYIASDQRQLTPSELSLELAGQQPDFEVTINGLRYARVYRLSSPTFGQALTLESVALQSRVVERGQPVRVFLRWSQTLPQGSRWRSHLQLMRTDSDVVDESVGEWQPGDGDPSAVISERHSMPAPRSLGRYTVAVTVERESPQELVPLTQRPPGLVEDPTRLLFKSVWVRVQ